MNYRSRHQVRGAAMVEAVIALPVFIVILIGVFYVRDQVLARQDAQAQARSCAWQYSANNCTEMPAGCEGVLGALTKDGASGAALTKALAGGADSALGSVGNELVDAALGGLLDDALSSALGSSVPAAATREVARPALYGGGTAVVKGRYTLACNLAPTTPGEVAKDAWQWLVP
jgi:hypothetical protein